MLCPQVIRLAQYLHRADVAITRGAEGKSGRVFVGDISEEHAVELASKFVSESFIFAVSALNPRQTTPSQCMTANNISLNTAAIPLAPARLVGLGMSLSPTPPSGLSQG